MITMITYLVSAGVGVFLGILAIIAMELGRIRGCMLRAEERELTKVQTFSVRGES